VVTNVRSELCSFIGYDIFGLEVLRGSSDAFLGLERHEELDGLLVSLVFDGIRLFLALRKILRNTPLA
jgi:hypothetical protein